MSPHGERGHRGPTMAPMPTQQAPKLTHLLAQSGTQHGSRGTYGTHNNVPTLVPRNNNAHARSTTATPATTMRTTTPSPALLSFTTAASMQESGMMRLLDFHFVKYICLWDTQDCARYIKDCVNRVPWTGACMHVPHIQGLFPLPGPNDS